MRVGGLSHVFQAVALPDIQRKPERGVDWRRFAQTAGGRTGMPAPRRVRRAPFVQWQAPLAWTTLSLTLHADGRAEGELIGASRFPRHWVYDREGRLTSKSGLIDFKDWYRKSFGTHTPWGDQESTALVTAVESALERSLSAELMRGAAKPRIRKVKAGTYLVRQGEKGSDVYLVLDGVLRVEVDGERLAECGPGALLGERAHVEGGARTSSLVAVTVCRVASVPAEALDARRSKNCRPGTAGKTWEQADRVRVHFLGVRGSTPAPGEDFVRYGGYTSCVALAHDGDAAPTLLLDAGTGIRRVSAVARRHGLRRHGSAQSSPLGPRPRPAVLHRRRPRGTCAALFLPEQPDGAPAADVLARGMSPPHFPIGPEGLRGKWSFSNLAPGTMEVDGFSVQTLEIPHKGGRTYGYRVADGKSVLTYMPDHCPTVLGSGPDGWGEYHSQALELATSTDALVHDAQLMAEELEAADFFGHATAEYAVELGRCAGARRVVLFHHQPDRTDNALDELGKRFGRTTQVIVAAESLVLEL